MCRLFWKPEWKKKTIYLNFIIKYCEVFFWFDCVVVGAVLRIMILFFFCLCVRARMGLPKNRIDWFNVNPLEWMKNAHQNINKLLTGNIKCQKYPHRTTVTNKITKMKLNEFKWVLSSFPWMTLIHCDDRGIRFLHRFFYKIVNHIICRALALSKILYKNIHYLYFASSLFTRIHSIILNNNDGITHIFHGIRKNFF